MLVWLICRRWLYGSYCSQPPVGEEDVWLLLLFSLTWSVFISGRCSWLSWNKSGQLSFETWAGSSFAAVGDGVSMSGNTVSLAGCILVGCVSTIRVLACILTARWLLHLAGGKTNRTRVFNTCPRLLTLTRHHRLVIFNNGTDLLLVLNVQAEASITQLDFKCLGGRLWLDLSRRQTLLNWHASLFVWRQIFFQWLTLDNTLHFYNTFFQILFLQF